MEIAEKIFQPPDKALTTEEKWAGIIDHLEDIYGEFEAIDAYPAASD